MNKIKYSLGEHKIGVDFWNSKQHLFESFYGDFYEFILNHGGKEDLEAKNIHSKEDFWAFADWKADGKDSCYGMGFAFHKYFLTPEQNGKIENQPTNTFIGYCYHNGKYLDFLNFLLSFFPWWRNDEGCTVFVPYNHADDFFNSSWAVLVDTCKLFYLSSETVYWWQSFRVKYALDHIPGTFMSDYKEEDCYCGEITLPRLRVAGYEFNGWFDNDGKEYKKACGEDLVLTALFTRKDKYTYWEVEEKKIHKEEDPNYKKVDPA